MEELIPKKQIFNPIIADESQLDRQIKWGYINNQSSQNESQLLNRNQDIKQETTKEDQMIFSTKIKSKQVKSENMVEHNSSKTEEQTESLCLLFNKHVFVKKTKRRKNPNFTKLLISCFSKEIKRLKIKNALTEQHKAFCQQAKKQYQKNGRRNIQMESLNILFGKDKQNQLYLRFNRSVLYNLFGRLDFKKYIVQNPFAKKRNIKQHLIAAKVYRLRCKSGNLTGRTQSK